MTPHEWAGHANDRCTIETCVRCGAKGITWKGVFRQTKGARECVKGRE